jgi:hypothetical protein
VAVAKDSLKQTSRPLRLLIPRPRLGGGRGQVIDQVKDKPAQLAGLLGHGPVPVGAPIGLVGVSGRPVGLLVQIGRQRGEETIAVISAGHHAGLPKKAVATR